MRTATVRTVSICVGLVALAFLQSPGLITADTKLDLVTNPGGLLQQGLLAWAPQGQFGQVQNQTYGYLWPMGPFFWLFHALGVSAWIVQRLWWAVVLVVGFTGARLLLARFGVGGQRSQLVGALAYVLAPRVIGVLGTTSVEAWPAMVLPWILLPLVVRHSAWRGAALSGVAMLLLGGVNATASLAVLVVPLLWLLTGAGVDRRLLRTSCWLVAVVLSCAWWLLPLVALRSFAYPFLDYIESASVTSAVTSLLNVLRGAQHWVAYSGNVAGPSWTAGFELALRPGLVLATSAVAGAGLLGLAWRRPRIAQQRFLIVCLAAGLLIMSTGYAGALGSPVAGTVQHLLDGALAPFRNVHKFDVLVRLPLVAGLTHVIANRHGLAAALVADRRSRAWVAACLAGVGVVAGLASVSPFLEGRSASRGAFESIPSYWSQTADWLDEHVADGRAMVLPASNFGEYTWGRPLDEPVTSLSRAPWVLRNAVPLGAPGAIRWMDGIDQIVRSGRASDELAGAFAAVGVTHVVLRNDLSVDMPRTPPAAVRATITASPGFRRVASFGPLATTFMDSQVVTGPGLPRQVEVYQVTRPVAEATLVQEPAVVAGGPEAATVPALVQAGLGTWIAAADLTDPGAGDGLTEWATDTLAKRSQNFGAERGRDLTSTLGADEDATRGRPAADISPFPASTGRTTARLEGAVIALSVSSSGDDPFGTGFAGPSARPFMAVDDDPDTSWMSDPLDRLPTVTLTLARPVSRLAVHLSGQSAGHRASVVQATAGSSTVRATVGQGEPVELRLPDASSEWQISIERDGTWPVGIAAIDGLPGRTSEVRELPVGSSSSLVVARMGSDRRACLHAGVDWACSNDWTAAGEELGPLVRSVPSPLPEGVPSVWVRAAASPELSRILDDAQGMQVTASSEAFDDPVARAGAMFDGDPTTGWIPAARDDQPRVEVETAPRRSATFSYRMDPRFEDVRATLVADGTMVARSVAPGARVSFEPVTAERWVILFTVQGSTPTPLRIREVDLGWPHDAGRITVGCADGPGLVIGQGRVHYRLSATPEELTSGALLQAEGCAGEPGAPSGTATRLESIDLPWLRVDQVAWLPDRVSRATPLTVTASDAQTRTFEIPAGAEGRVVALTEGFNEGWRAELAGQALDPIRLEGWRQGWRIPRTDQAAVITARFAPSSAHVNGLLLGWAAAVVLVLIGTLAWMTREPAALPPRSTRPVRRARMLALAVVVGAFLLAGPVGAGVAVLCLPLWRREHPVALLGPAVLISAAGLLQAARGQGWLGLAQLLCVASLALAAGALVDPVEERPLEEHVGQPRDRRGDQQGASRQEPEAPTEQRYPRRRGDELEDEQVPEEHAVADPAGPRPGRAAQDSNRA